MTTTLSVGANRAVPVRAVLALASGSDEDMHDHGYDGDGEENTRLL